MDVTRMIEDLRGERRRIEQAIAALEGLAARPGAVRPAAAKASAKTAAPARRKMSAAARKRMSQAMKKRWAARRRKAKTGK